MRYNVLRGKIVERGYNNKALADEMGLTPLTMSRKVRGKTQLCVPEAAKLAKILKLSDSEIIDIFFA